MIITVETEFINAVAEQAIEEGDIAKAAEIYQSILHTKSLKVIEVVFCVTLFNILVDRQRQLL